MNYKINKVLSWFYNLPLKKIVQINVGLLLLIAVPLTIGVVNRRTSLKSEAALLSKPSIQPKSFETPKGPPEIYLVDHFFGKVGDAVLIHGDNLGGESDQSWVALGGQKIPEENIVEWAGNFIEFTVPEKASSGSVEISVLGNRTIWPGMFFVIDENLDRELRLEGAGQEVKLKGKGLEKGSELLVWLLVIKGEDVLSFSEVEAVEIIKNQKISLPIGVIWEFELSLDENLVKNSSLEFVNLLNLAKASDEQVIGIARVELKQENGNILPIMCHPLYVVN